MIGLCVLTELAFWLAGLFGDGQGRLRQTAYEYAGFWPGLLYGWQPNYPLQPVAMFLTYGFLHGGAGHLIFNMITLWSLGTEVAARVGARGFAILYGASLLGGSLGYALLAQSPQPMVGASGALFGLAGAVLCWSYLDRRQQAAGLWPVLRVVLFLVALNVVMWWALNGHLAWQTHLGGFVTGWVVAWGFYRGPGLSR